MAKTPEYKKFKKYRIYYPGNLTENQVLLAASEFTTGEPVILAYPQLAGNYEVGYCDYKSFMRFTRKYALKFFPITENQDVDLAETSTTTQYYHSDFANSAGTSTL